jgi:hypothetical protein
MVLIYRRKAAFRSRHRLDHAADMALVLDTTGTGVPVVPVLPL